MAPFFTGLSGALSGQGGFGFSRRKNFFAGIIPKEYVFFGTTGSSTTGTLLNLSGYTTITVAGVGAGGDGNPTSPGACCPGRGGGGGAAANIRGNSFPVPGNGITSIYYSVGGSNGADTFIQINGPGGTDLIRFRGGSPNTGQTAGSGGPNVGGGPNCVSGGAGGGGGARYAGGGPAGGVTNACAGGGGSGGAVDNGQPGTTGGSGGPSNFTPIAPTVVTTTAFGPAPTTWSIGPAGPHAGGGGGYGSTAGTTNGTNAGDVSWAEGGGGGGAPASPGSGELGSGGAGAGIRWTDPSDPTNNGKFFGGGGGALGATSLLNPLDGKGGKGFLIIQLS